MISKKKSKCKSWQSYYSDNNINLLNLPIDKSWKHIFLQENIINKIKIINRYLTEIIKKNKDIQIFPYPELLFSSFNITRFNNVKVVILGQDPYFSSEKINNKVIPQAIGLSFSVPEGCKIPSSLKNIYKNLSKYKHINNIPINGNLTSWAKQGCLLLNTSLTVQEGSKNKNGHSKYWKSITDVIIKYLSISNDISNRNRDRFK